jgi:hypothetical protein
MISQTPTSTLRQYSTFLTSTDIKGIAKSTSKERASLIEMIKESNKSINCPKGELSNLKVVAEITLNLMSLHFILQTQYLLYQSRHRVH